jgi:hypothetical protein
MVDGESDDKVGSGKPAAHSVQEGPVRQPRWPQQQDPASVARRCAQRKGLRYDRRTATQDHEARGDGTQMIKKSTSPDLPATKMLIDLQKDVEQKAGGASPPPEPRRSRGGRGDGGTTGGADPAAGAAGDRRMEDGGPVRIAARIWARVSPPHLDPPFAIAFAGGSLRMRLDCRLPWSFSLRAGPAGLSSFVGQRPAQEIRCPTGNGSCRRRSRRG